MKIRTIILGGPSAQTYLGIVNKDKAIYEFFREGVCRTPGCLVGQIAGAKCLEQPTGTTITCLSKATKHLGLTVERG